MRTENGVRVGLAGPGQWATVRQVRLAALTDAPEAFASTLDRELGFDETHWRERIARGPWFLAWQEEQPVGLVTVGPQPPGRTQAWHLMSMWVSPQLRGRGAADQLVAAAIEHVRAAGGSSVTLWVAVGNDRARGFYQRMGFRPTGIREIYPRAGAPDLDEEKLALDL
jgi:ribosomal protein S18 acetylase RimI-like enzyme